jgi:hypothetical protein
VKRPIIFVVLAGLYFTALAWLVRREGNSYRRDLKQRRTASAHSIETPTQTLEESTPNRITTQATQHAPARPLAPPIDNLIVPDGPDAAPMPAAKKVADITPWPLANEKPLLNARSPTLRGLTPDLLRGIGEDLFKAVSVDGATVDDHSDTKLLERLLNLWGELAEGRVPGGNGPWFHVLNSQEVNAFSHVGDHIYVSRGVFALAQVDAELQFVVAHELAHLKLGHTAARLEQVARGSHLAIGLGPWLHHLIALGFSDDQEFAADVWAYQALTRIGRSRREALGFLRRYSTYAEEHRLSVGRHPPQSQPGSARQDLDNHYRAHPPVRERLARLEAETSTAKTGRAP